MLYTSHSELTFKIKHLMITNVKGEFQKFDASIESDGSDFKNAKVRATIDAGSIYTNNADRDAHLNSADFFDVDTHKDLTHETTELKKLDEDRKSIRMNSSHVKTTHA